MPPTVYVSVFDASRAAPRDGLWLWTQLFAPDGTLVDRATRDATAVEVTVRKPAGGHDEHGANLPVTRPFEVASPFGLARARDLRGAAPLSCAPGTEDGFLPLLDHPPDSSLTAAC